jgi:hypothetical protein
MVTSMDMMNYQLRQAGDRLGRLEEGEVLARAKTAIANLIRKGKIIKDPHKEIKKLAAMRTDTERDKWIEHIAINYAERAMHSEIHVFADEDEVIEAKEPIEAADLVRYSEENPTVDINTEAGLKKALAALTRR